MVGTERGGNGKSSSRLTRGANATRVLEPLIDIRCAITSTVRACRAEFFNRIDPKASSAAPKSGQPGLSMRTVASDAIVDPMEAPCLARFTVPGRNIFTTTQCAVGGFRCLDHSRYAARSVSCMYLLRSFAATVATSMQSIRVVASYSPRIA